HKKKRPGGAGDYRRQGDGEEPGERYATAQDLADDLTRFLKDEPIRARRPSWWQRLKRSARRHKPAVVSALLATTVVLLLTGGWAAWWAQQRAETAHRAELDLQMAAVFQSQARWADARLAVERAEGRLGGGAGNKELRRRARQVHADLDMVARLEEI